MIEPLVLPVRRSVSEVADKLAIWSEEKEIHDDER
ncbi:hypothetical protein SAMN06295879_0235 [Agreia bicolorata]|uniref:Uncharacterized protein n=1 Tax=Agreia bicolorata TaxID=110935 RepID=A0A1T4WVS6_9MICO|nr:hypothetical protein SAMN06295879_0235 [Agreia bicolorata]